MTAVLASIPSPHTNVLHLGPLVIHLYGVTLLVAILLCCWLTSRRWRALGGDPDLVVRVAVWGVAFGVVGARAYHDVTSWSTVPDPKWKGVFEVWEGGLGIWGGILFGVLAGIVVIHRAGLRAAPFMDAVAPGILLAQGIGRIGNWWNQELFGKPTSLPWGLRIDASHAAAYEPHRVFQPTFLYELIWDVVGAGVLIWIGKRFVIRAPGLFALYVVWYCFGRFFEELLRIDPSHHLWGLRLNAWVSLVCFLAGLIAFIRIQRNAPEGTPGGGTGGSVLRSRVRMPKLPRRTRKVPPPPRMDIPKGRVR